MVWFQIRDIMEKTKLKKELKKQWVPTSWPEEEWTAGTQGILGQWNYSAHYYNERSMMSWTLHNQNNSKNKTHTLK
jgi:hypothetical protein